MKKVHDQKISEIIKEFTDQKPLKSKLQLKKVESCWLELFGNLTNQYLDKMKLQNRKLIIYLRSPSLIQELNMNKKMILNHLNQRLGDDQIEEISFR